MEYVIVRTDDDTWHTVRIDGVQSGRTGLALAVQTGHHTFAICRCTGDRHGEGCHAERYRPVSRDMLVEDTVRIAPMEVLFERADA